MAVPKWLTLADKFVEQALASLTEKVRAGELSPEVTIAAINAVTQRTTTHRAVIVEQDESPGRQGDRRDRAPTVVGTKGKGARGEGSAARGRRPQAPTARDVDPAGE